MIPVPLTKRLRRTSLRSAVPISSEGPLRENEFPLITFLVDSSTWMPGPGLPENELPWTRMRVEPNIPIPSPSGAMLSLPVLPRTTLRADWTMRNPKKAFFVEETFSTLFSSALPTKTPLAKSRTEPLRTVTPSRPSLTTPMSHSSFLGHCSNSLPSPATTWPFRSSVMLSAPITMPLFGQSRRSLSRVVSAVIVSPHFTWLLSARGLS
jgi:hypothetical protein